MDDLADAVYKSEAARNLFTTDSHHNNITVILTVQNYFQSSPFGKSLTRNCSEKIIFKDKSGIFKEH
jgi:hypothetical protein